MSDDEWNPSAELAEEGASPSNIGPLSLEAEGSFRYEPHSPGGIQLRLKAMPEQVCLDSDLVCTGDGWASSGQRWHWAAGLGLSGVAICPDFVKLC